MGDEKRKGGKMTRVNTRSDVSEQLLIKAEIVTRVSSLTSSLITESRASPSFFFFVQSSMMSDHSCLPCSSAEATFTNPVCTIGTVCICIILTPQVQSRCRKLQRWCFHSLLAKEDEEKLNLCGDALQVCLQW